MEILAFKKPYVSVTWVHEHLKATNLVILDTSIPKVTDTSEKNVSSLKIPGTRFFDIKHKFSRTDAPFPNTFPSEGQFTREARRLGINSNSALVIYDDKGLYSSPRAWWMFRAMGHKNVAVLDGGLPLWEAAGYETEEYSPYPGDSGNFTAHYDGISFVDFEMVKTSMEANTHRLIDARSEERFTGMVPEPRKGLRSGTIPGSSNLPYTALLNNGRLKKESELMALFREKITEQDRCVFSCGSGITACVLALGATLAGYKNLAVYDGSWTEWGSLTKQ